MTSCFNSLKSHTYFATLLDGKEKKSCFDVSLSVWSMYIIILFTGIFPIINRVLEVQNTLFSKYLFYEKHNKATVIFALKSLKFIINFLHFSAKIRNIFLCVLIYFSNLLLPYAIYSQKVLKLYFLGQKRCTFFMYLLLHDEL